MKNSLIKVLSFVMALTMIVGCFTAISFSAAECNHTKGAKGETVAPTCVKPGFTWYTCATCGDQYMDDVTAATGKHTEVVDPATDATCTSPAMTAGKKCSVCKAVIEAKQPVAGSKALGHNFMIKEAAATCGSANKSYYECTRCNKTAEKAGKDEGKDYLTEFPTTTYGEVVNHNWEYAVVVAPTVCADGKVTVTCKNCKVVKNVTAPAVHQYVEITNPASCAEYKSGEVCARCGNIKNGVKNDKVKHDWQNVTGMNASVEALGIKNVSELSKAPTCLEAGYVVQKCINCNQYAKNAVKATGHTATWGEVIGGEQNKDANVCVTERAKTQTCSVCKAVLNKTVVAAAVAHDLKTEEIKATCTADGYTKVTCKNEGCNYETRSNYKDATGHTWSAWTYTGNCESGITGTRKCTVKGCTATETTTTPAGAHNMTTGSVVKTVDATCQAKAYYVYYCQNANCAYTEKVAGSEFGEKNAANHKDLTKSFTKTAATCTTTGVDVYLCACGTTIEKTVNTVDHVKGTSYSSGGKVVVNVNAVAANCQTDGKTAGECCVNCGKILKAQEVVSKSKLDLSKASSHKDTTPDNHGAPVAATCISDGYQLAYFSCCGYVKTNIVKASADKHVIETIAYKAPSCTEAGNHAYVGCTVKGCGYVASVSAAGCPGCAKDHDVVEATLDATIAALGHKLKDVKAVAEKCDVDGTTAHKLCERCGYTEGKRVIPAHGDKYKTASKAVAATCTTKGKIAVTAGTLCQVCDVAQIEVAALGHKYVGTPVNTNDCTKPTYTVYECANGCGSSYAADFVPGKEAHNYELNWHKVENKDGIVLDGTTQLGYACQVGTYEYRKCVNCDQVVKQNEKAAISHYYMMDGSTKVEIKLNCKDIANFDGHTCALCGAKVVADSTKAGTADLTVAHNFKTTTKAATCTEGGYTITACAACGLVKENVPTPATKHAVKYVIETKAATNGADGYTKYMCSKCNTEVTEVIPAYTGLILNIKAADKVAYANGQLKVTVALSASKYEFNSIHFQFAINNEQIKLAAKDAVKVEYAFAATDYVTAVASDNGDYVDVLVYVPNGADGKAKNVSVSGTDVAFLTLTFDVLATANGDLAIPAVLYDYVHEYDETTGEYIGSTQVEIPAAKLTEAVKYLKDGKLVAKSDVTLNVTEFKTTVMGNVNNDDKLDAGDSVALQTAIYDGSYIAGADFDKNGKIDLADHAAFLKFITSKQSVIDYLAAMNISIEGIVADMNLKYDIDGDRAAGTDNDKAVLAAFIVAELSEINYLEWSADLEEVVEEVAFMIASGSIKA